MTTTDMPASCTSMMRNRSFLEFIDCVALLITHEGGLSYAILFVRIGM